jgi:hypothetical protein
MYERLGQWDDAVKDYGVAVSSLIHLHYCLNYH